MAGRQRAPAEAPDYSAILFEMKGQIGELTGTVKQMNERMGEFGESLQTLAQGQEHTASEVSAMGATVKGLKSDVADLKHRKPPEVPPDTPKTADADATLSFGKKWLPWLFAGGVTVAGAIWGVIERLSKGGNSTP